MNPDTWTPEYQAMVLERERQQRSEAIRRRELHNKAMKRRRKAKRGGRR